MIIVWGTQLYGRVEKVEGLGHVATEFHHLFWIPLLPSHSYFVLNETFQKYEGIPVANSGKSILAGYGFALSIFFILLGIGSFGAMNDPQNAMRPASLPFANAFMLLGALSAPVLVWLQSSKFRMANYETASEMAALTRDDRVQVYVDHHFGRITDQEADPRIESLEAVGTNFPEHEMRQGSGTSTYVPYAISTQ